jgi:hypothetical protein
LFEFVGDNTVLGPNTITVRQQESFVDERKSVREFDARLKFNLSKLCNRKLAIKETGCFVWNVSILTASGETVATSQPSMVAQSS